MSEMNELSELYEESNDLQMDVMPGESDLPHIKVGGGAQSYPRTPPARPVPSHSWRRKAPWRRRRPSPEEQPGQIAGPEFESESEGEGEEFDDWEDDYDSPEEEPLSGEGYRVSAALEEATRMFLRTSRAREAALDGTFQMHSEKTLFDQLAFIGEFSLMVVSRLTEELGCDEIIDRE